MKIVRRKNGYSIRCSDGEFDALRTMVDYLDANLDIHKQLLSGGGRAGYTRRTAGGKFLRVDVDNRDA